MSRIQHLKILDRAREQIHAWAGEEGIDLHRTEVMLPFAEGDVSLGVWFFFKSRQTLVAHDRSGVTRGLAERFLATLHQLECPPYLLSGVNFRFVTDETAGDG
ncbi:MAG TPA: hypothetical protein DEB35_02605 [Desulfuromonas sp.]|nr:hypothetical protein [Desulfuromonas sp.]